MRLPISTTLVQVAAANGQLEVLALTKPEVERWLKEWNVSDEEKSQFLKTIIDALTQAGKACVFLLGVFLPSPPLHRDSAYEYRILLVHTLPSSSPESRSAAVDTIVAALRIPTVFDFDTLYSLDPIIAVGDHELFPLLQIFLKNGIPEFRAWTDDHSAVLETHRTFFPIIRVHFAQIKVAELENAQLERKIRLLAFSSLAFDYIGRDLPYSTIASTLQIDASHVEKWTIDGKTNGILQTKGIDSRVSHSNRSYFR